MSRVQIAVALLFSSLLARAETITFNNAYPTKVDAQFNALPYTEGSFTVSQFAGKIVFDPLVNGNVGVRGEETSNYQLPPLGGTALVALTNGGLFTYAGLDAFFSIGTPLGAGNLTVTGYKGGQQVGADTYTIPSPFTYAPETATNLNGVALDQLLIQLPGAALEGGYSFYFAADNINVTPLAATTPEPSALVLLGTGLLSTVALGRNRFTRR